MAFGIKLIQRNIAGRLDMHLAKLDRSSHVNQIELLACLAKFRKLLGRNRGNAHGFLLTSCFAIGPDNKQAVNELPRRIVPSMQAIIWARCGSAIW